MAGIAQLYEQSSDTFENVLVENVSIVGSYASATLATGIAAQPQSPPQPTSQDHVYRDVTIRNINGLASTVVRGVYLKETTNLQLINVDVSLAGVASNVTEASAYRLIRTVNTQIKASTSSASAATGATRGVYVDGGSVSIDDMELYGNGTGLFVTASGRVTLGNSDFDLAANNQTDIRLEATAGTLTLLSGNEFAGDNYFIDNRSAQGFNLAGNSSTFDETDNYRIEDKMYHQVDAPTTSGLIRWVTGNVYVSKPGTGANDETIQGGIEAAADGDTVNVEAGTHPGTITTAGKALTLAAGSSAGQVTVNGDLTLDSNDTLAIEINGPDAATQYDNWIVNGAVALGGATLSLSGSYTPTVGQNFTLISNDLTDAVTGTLAGAPFTVAGVPYTIAYTGGTGNDVVLTQVAPTTVWVDDDYYDADNDGGHIWGYDAFATIQAGINAVATTGTVNILDGTYVENPSLSSSVKQVNFVGATDVDGTPLPTIRGTLSIDLPFADNNWRVENINFVADTATAALLSLKNVNGVTIDNCTFDGSGRFMASPSVNGILFVSGGNGNTNVTIEDSAFQNGLYCAINGTVGSLTVKNSTIENVKSGLNIQSGAADLIVQDTDISVVAQAAGSDTYGIRFGSTDAASGHNLTVSGTTISVDKNGLVADAGTYHSAIIVRSGANGALAVNTSTIAGELVNLSSVPLDATSGNTIDGVDISTATLAQLFAVEDSSIRHKVDNATWGLIRVKPANIYVTPLSGSIQRGIDAATTGDTVNVQAGSYVGGADAATGGKNVALAAGSSPAQVTVDGDLTLNSGDTLLVDLAGATAGSGYDQWVINETGTDNGPVTLGSATLTLNLTYAPAVGTVYTLISNDDNDAVSGTFGNVTSNGGTITATYNSTTYTFRVYYTGGDGNDVVLVENSAPPTTTYAEDTAWTGLSSGTIVDGNLATPEFETAIIGFNAFTTIQAAINAVATSGVVQVNAGTYHERLTVNKAITLCGAQYGTDPTPVGARTVPAAESVVDLVGLGVTNPNVLLEIPAGVQNVTIDGFTLNGSSVYHNADEAAIRAGTGSNILAIRNNIVDGYQDIVIKGANGLTIDQNRIRANKNGIVVQPGTSTDVHVGGNTFAPGASLQSDTAAIYMTSASSVQVVGNTATGFTTGRGLYGSNYTNLSATGNNFSGNNDGISLFGATTNVQISGNTLTNNLRYGVNIKGQDLNVTTNTITGNVVGIIVDKHTLTTERVTIAGNIFDAVTPAADNATDIRITSTVTSFTIGAGNQFAGDNYFIDNQTTQSIDLTSYTGANFEGLTDNFRIEDRMYHALDNASAALITWVAGQRFVTTPGTGASDETIQRAIDAATSGDTVHVEAGTYTGGANAAAVAKNTILSAGASPAQVVVNGNLTLDAGDTLPVELNGATAGSGYDQWVVTVGNSVDVTGATLTVTRGYDPAFGVAFTIIDNQGSSAVTGTFAGLAEGATVTVDNVPLTISYVGGTGNDVTLTLAQPLVVWANDTWLISNDLAPSGLSYGDIVYSNTGATPPDADVSGKVFGYNAFATIQSGINAVAVTGTVHVLAGTYDESVSVNKTVAVLGAQAGVRAQDASRPAASESIITGLTSNGGVGMPANNAVIDGFLIEECDSGNGAGVWLSASYSGNQVLNNIIRNNTMGLSLGAGGTAQTVIRGNLFQTNNRPGAASGDAIYGDTAMKNILIDDNKFLGNSSAMVLLGGVYGAFGPVSGLSVTNNVVDGGGSGGGMGISGQYVVGHPGALDTNLVFTGNVVTNMGAGRPGLRVVGVDNAVIAENDIHGTGDAVQVLYASTNVTVRNNDLTGNDHAVYLGNWAYRDQVTVLHNDVSGYTSGAVVNGGRGDENGGWEANPFDASGNWWGSDDPAVVAGKVTGVVDFAAILNDGNETVLPSVIGFYPEALSVTVHTLGAQMPAISRIQDGVNVVAEGGTITVLKGTYTGEVSINKGLTLVSANGKADTIIEYGSVSVGNDVHNVTIGQTDHGFTFHNQVWLNGSGWSDVTVAGNAFDAGWYALIAYGGSDATITDNTFAGDLGDSPDGLVWIAGENIDVTNNRFTGSAGGVLCYSQVVNSDITGNTFDGTSDTGNLMVWGAGNTITGNTFNGSSYASKTYQIYDGTGTYDIAALLSGNTYDRAVTVFDGTTYLPAIWANIQGGINAAVDGDTVNVEAGTYAEDVIINKSVTLDGDGDPTATSFTLTNGAVLGGGSGGITAPTVYVNQVGAAGARVQDGILLAADNGTVNVAAGDYANSVNVNKSATLAPGAGTGNASVTVDDLRLGGTSTLAIDIGGTNPATPDFDQITVDGDGGTVNIESGAKLSLSLGTFTPSDGDTFVIVDNDDADAIAGTFDGLDEGAVLNSGNSGWTAGLACITYKGGAGNNDVKIMVGSVYCTPVAHDDAVANIPPGAVMVEVTKNDSDPNGNLLVTSVDLDPTTPAVQDMTWTVPGQGTWTVSTTYPGYVLFTPQTGFTYDPALASYAVKDVSGLTSNTASISLDYRPVTTNDTSTGNTAGTAVTVDVLANDTNGDQVVPTTVMIVGSGGPVTSLDVLGEGTWTVLTTGEITFTPQSGFAGDPTPIRYTVQDDDGNTSNSATVTIDYVQAGPACSAFPFTLVIDDLSTPGVLDIVIVDNQGIGAAGAGGRTSNRADGSMTVTGEIYFSGATPKFSLARVTARSKPLVGTAAEPENIALTASLRSATGGTIVVEATDSCYEMGTGGAYSLTTPIGGTTNGWVTFTETVDLENDPFASGTAGLSNTLGPYPAGSVSGSKVTSFTSPAYVSLDKKLTVTHPTGAKLTGITAGGILAEVTEGTLSPALSPSLRKYRQAAESDEVPAGPISSPGSLGSRQGTELDRLEAYPTSSSAEYTRAGDLLFARWGGAPLGRPLPAATPDPAEERPMAPNPATTAIMGDLRKMEKIEKAVIDIKNGPRYFLQRAKHPQGQPVRHARADLDLQGVDAVLSMDDARWAEDGWL